MLRQTSELREDKTARTYGAECWLDWCTSKGVLEICKGPLKYLTDYSLADMYQETLKGEEKEDWKEVDQKTPKDHKVLWILKISSQRSGKIWASQVVLVVKNPPADAGDTNSIFGSRKFPGEGNGNPHSNILAWRTPQTDGSWQAMVYAVTKSWLRLKQLEEAK